MKSPQCDLPRSLIQGILLITGLYLLMSAVYAFVLPINEMARTELLAGHPELFTRAEQSP